MSGKKPKQIKSWRGRLLVGLLVGTAVVFWFGHPPAFSWILRNGLRMLCEANGYEFQTGRIETQIGRPFVIEDARLLAIKDSGSRTALQVARIEWRWNGIGGFFSQSGRAVSSATLRNLTGVWDFRAPTKTPKTLLSALPSIADKEARFSRWIPLAVDVDRTSVEVLWANQRWAVRDLNAHFSENEVGRLELGSLLIQCGSFTKSFASLHGTTACKNGTLWLSGMELAPGIAVENFSIEALDRGGPSVSLLATVFGGSLRGDVKFATTGRTWDLSLWASNVALQSVPPLLGLEGKAAGRLVEGRLTFRGQPERPADAEASLRLVADSFHWNDRGWESLEIGSSLIHRRLVVTNFDFRQKENRVHLNGEVSLAEGWEQIATSPFLLNVQADIKDVKSLAGILGGPFDEVAGRMTAVGALSGRPDKVNGFLSLEASNIEFRSLPVSSLRVDSVFRQSEIEITRCDAYSRKDTLQAKANIGLAAPHHYTAELSASLADLAAYLVPFRAPGAGAVYAGSMAVRWQGDGSAKAHSGAFDIQLENFVSRFTPAGLTGKFAGTYSPQNMYFSKMEMDNGRLHLGSRTTVAASGVTVKDLELRAGEATLLEGSGFFPINAFAVASGTDWRAAIEADREAYIRAVTPKELNIPDLMRLAGQDFPLQGRLRLQLEAGGPPAQLHADGVMSARGLSMPAAEQAAMPESTLDAKITARDGVALLDGLVQTRGLGPLTLKARSPFGLARTEGGNWRWINPNGEFEASLDFPRTDVSVFSPFLPNVGRLKGEVSGRLELTQTFANPKFSGRVDLKNGGIESFPPLPAVEKTEAGIVFEGADMRIERFRGEAGAGPFEITGGAKFSSAANPSIDIRLHGERISLARDAGLRLGANVDLHASGTRNAGKVDGSVRLLDGRFDRRFAITPVLAALPEATPNDIKLPVLPGRVPAPFSQWMLDVKVENETPFLLRGNLAQGKIIPDIWLTGTLGQPVPSGRITLKDVRAFMPAATFTIPDGRIDFFPNAPWVPFLDVRGTAKLPGYEVQAYAFGPLNARKLILRSEPPIAQEPLQLLLATGIAPNPPGAGLETEPGGLPLLRAYLQPFDIPGADPNCLQVRAVPTEMLRRPASLHTKILLWDNNDHEGFQTHNTAPSYLWRFE